MTKPTPDPNAFALRPPTSDEVKKFRTAQAEKERQERESKQPHDTVLIFNPMEGGGRTDIETAGWVYEEASSGDDFVVLKKKVGPGIPHEQRIRAKGIAPERVGTLTAWLTEKQNDANVETVKLRFVDEIT